MNIKTKINARMMAVIAVLAVLFTAGSTVAYFTDYENVSNNFTVGDISLKLQEPNWDEEKGKDLTPNKTVPKDPEIVNDGANEAYVFLSADVPYRNVRTANADGSMNSAADTELFTYKVNDGWKLISSEKLEASGVIRHVYAYTGNGSDMKKLSTGEKTPSLFDSVTFANVVEGELERSTSLCIDIRSYGIQTDGIGTDHSPAAVWSIMEKSVSK